MNKKIFLLLSTFFTVGFACEQKTNMIGLCSHANGKTQEDALTIKKMENNIFCGLYDGNGGSYVSDYLANKLHVFFECCLSEQRTKKDAFSYAFNQVEDHVTSQKNQENAGASALAVYLEGNKAHIAWAGTVSLALGCNKNIAFQTKDHTLSEPANFLILNACEANRIMRVSTAFLNSGHDIFFREYIPEQSTDQHLAPVGYWLINGVNRTRFIGHPWQKGLYNCRKRFPQPHRYTSEKHAVYMQSYSGKTVDFDNNSLNITPLKGQIIAEPEYKEITLTEKNRWLVIATNTLTSIMSNQEMMEVIHNYYYEQNIHCLDTIANKLVKMAIERGCTRNISVIVMDLLANRA